MTFFRKYQFLIIAAFALFVSAPVSAQMRQAMGVGSISVQIEGPQYISNDAVMAHIKLREGEPFDQF